MSGRGNPKWVWDEQVLAFDLYLREGQPGASHSEVIALSLLLNEMDFHPLSKRASTFRNPNGIARNLADIHTHSPGYTGKPTSGSQLIKQIWEEFDERLDDVTGIALLIRQGVAVGALPVEDEDEVSEVHSEGKVVYRLHRSRERSPKLRKQKIAQIKKTHGVLLCEACGEAPNARYGSLGDLILECHHLMPLAVSGPVKTSLSDVALLCPSCHRVAHRMKPWPTLDDLQRFNYATPGKEQ